MRVEPTSSAELFDFFVICRVLLAIERRRSRRTKLRAATHSKRHDESPLRQQIGKKRRRSWYPNTRTTAARWLNDGIGTIIRPRREDLGRDEFAPRNAICLLWTVWNSSENRGVKRIEGRCVAWKQVDKRLVRSGAGSGYARCTGRTQRLAPGRVRGCARCRSQRHRSQT